MPDIVEQAARPCTGCYLGPFGPPLEPYGTAFTRAENHAATPDASVADAHPAGTAHWLVLNRANVLDRISLPGVPAADSIPIRNDGLLARAPRGAGGDPLAPDHGPTLRLTRLEAEPIDGAAIAGSRSGPWDRAPGNVPGPTVPDYPGSQQDVINATGLVPAIGTPWIKGSIPYWRVAVQKDLERHFLQIGTYGMTASAFPSGGQSAGTTDSFTNIGADASYRFVVNPGGVVSNVLSTRATFSHEARSLDASNRVLGANGFNTLDTFRADASWSIADTVTPSIQYFRAGGSVDAVRYFSPGGRPNSSGVIAGLVGVPWAGLASPIQFLNVRLAAQYVVYTQINGLARGAGGNNALYLSLWGALHF